MIAHANAKDKVCFANGTWVFNLIFCHFLAVLHGLHIAAQLEGRLLTNPGSAPGNQSFGTYTTFYLAQIVQLTNPCSRARERESHCFHV